MSHRKLIAQYDASKVFGGRPVEKALLTHHGIHAAVTCVGRVGLTAMVWPRFFAPFRLVVRQFEMRLPGLDAAFEGYRILYLSDLHAGRTKQKYLRQVLGNIAKIKPDLILIGGDLIDYHPRSLPRIAELLPLFVAPDGAYTIFGNHDYHEYSWRHIGPRSAKRVIHRKLVELVTKSRVRLLRNESVTVTRGMGKLQIVGLDEMWCNRFDAEAAWHGLRNDVPTICLIHNPDACEFVMGHHWDWALAGHSHGGQVDIPGYGPLFLPMAHPEWLRGFFEFERKGEAVTRGRVTHANLEDVPKVDRERRAMFVSTGVGHSKAIRMRVPPEICVFTLRGS